MSKESSSDFQSRRRWLIYPRFQLTLIGINALVLFGVFGIVALQSWRSVQRLADLGVSAGLAASHPYFEFLNVQARTVNSYLAVGCLLGFVLSSVLIMVLSHRMAGPLIRLRSHFEAVKATGEYRTLSFRKNDYFSDLPEVINDGMQALRDREKSKRAS